MIEAIGWVSSLILLATLVNQVHKQWKEGSSENISKWLFIGQLVSSVGFTIYSVFSENWVFVFTNGVLTINNIVGICFYFYFLKKNKKDS